MSEPKSCWLSELTWEEVDQLLADGPPVVLLPVGSTEQHGPHLPLGTDTYVALDLVTAVAAGTRVVVAPPLWYGLSPHHMVLPGSITVRPEVLLELAYDIVASLAAHGFDQFIMVNGHRIANLPWLQLVAERVHRELPECRVVIFDPAYMSKEIAAELAFGPVGHAEEIETSHLLAARPELVRMERAVDHPAPHRPLYHVDPRQEQDTLCYVPTPPTAARRQAHQTRGVTGRPTLATAEKGRRYREHLVRRLLQVIEQLSSSRGR